MKITNKQLSLILALWIKNDPLIWGEFGDVQINLIVDRFVKAQPLSEMQAKYKVDPKRLNRMIHAIIHKVSRHYGSEIAGLLLSIHGELEGRAPNRIEMDFNQIFLN